MMINKNTIGLEPSLRVHATDNPTKIVVSASQPWSNNSPSGELVPVRRACLPSSASSVWYSHKQRKFVAQSHCGTTSDKLGLYKAVTTKLAKQGTNPANVIKLGLQLRKQNQEKGESVRFHRVREAHRARCKA